MVVQELAKIAFAEAGDNLRMVDKLSAINMLAKHLGMYIERQEAQADVLVSIADLFGGRDRQ